MNPALTVHDPVSVGCAHPCRAHLVIADPDGLRLVDVNPPTRSSRARATEVPANQLHETRDALEVDVRKQLVQSSAQYAQGISPVGQLDPTATIGSLFGLGEQMGEEVGSVLGAQSMKEIFV